MWTGSGSTETNAEVPSSQPTCEDDPHESVSEEGVVNEAPQPLEVGEEVMHRVRTGFEQQTNPRPQLGYRARERETQREREREVNERSDHTEHACVRVII